MHQGWPKFTQNLWYATPDRGLAALVYAPSEVSARVADGTEVSFTEETTYPFDETIRFVFSTLSKKNSVQFPFHLRVPQWCKKAIVKINGASHTEAAGGTLVKIDREWTSGDRVELLMPMHLYRNRWYENSVSVERGPLVYALKIADEWKAVSNQKDPAIYGATYYEVLPRSPWNYGLVYMAAGKLEEGFVVSKKAQVATFPWNPENAPIEIKTKARRIPSWQLYNGMTGPLPYSPLNGLETGEAEEILLILYGCTNLRISQFPLW